MGLALPALTRTFMLGFLSAIKVSIGYRMCVSVAGGLSLRLQSSIFQEAARVSRGRKEVTSHHWSLEVWRRRHASSSGLSRATCQFYIPQQVPWCGQHAASAKTHDLDFGKKLEEHTAFLVVHCRRSRPSHISLSCISAFLTATAINSDNNSCNDISNNIGQDILTLSTTESANGDERITCAHSHTK